AAGARRVEGMGRALAGGGAALGMEIEEVVALAAQARADEPILERNRPVVIARGMADEQSRHAFSPVAGCPEHNRATTLQQRACQQGRFGSMLCAVPDAFSFSLLLICVFGMLSITCSVW